MRYIDLREILELTVATLIGLAAAWYLLDRHPQIIPKGIAPDLWLGLGAMTGFLVAVMWSAWRVDKKVDKRIPLHLRTAPKFSDGRPFGVAAWRTRDASSEYLWVLLGVLIVLVIIWLAKTYEPGWFR